MTTPNTRFMRPADWAPTPIPPGRYCNPAPLTGYRMADGTGGNPLHPASPADDFESRLADEMERVRSLFPAVVVGRYHLLMPYRPPGEARLPTAYRFVSAPRRLTTTSVTVVTVPRSAIAEAALGYCFAGEGLPTLRERLRGHPFRGLVGNLGYYMTAELLGRKFPWSHAARYPRFPLPKVCSYVGFHLYAGDDGVESGFLGAHPAAVAVGRDGRVEILPRLAITAYRVTLAGREFVVRSVNAPDRREGVMLFTPGLMTPEVRAHEDDWRTYAPLLPLPGGGEGRVNLFIANEGDGRRPVERVVAVWTGAAPLPSFGAVLSFDRRLLNGREAHALVGQRVRVRPLGGSDLSRYVQVLGGLVPLVVDGEHVLHVETVAQLTARLREYGALSPIARSSRESDNFAPRVREPAGVLVQTEGRVGWVLCDGRHEMSIGADIADVARIVRLLEEAGVFGGPVREAVFIDGGSAMKVYGVASGGGRVALHLLNRVAAGARNGPGKDEEGLNLYSVLRVATRGKSENGLSAR